MIQSYLVQLLLIIWQFHWVKKRGKSWKGRLWVHETPILDIAFGTLIDSSICDMAPKVPKDFYLLIEKFFSRYFQVWSRTIRLHSGTRNHLFIRLWLIRHAVVDARLHPCPKLHRRAVYCTSYIMKNSFRRAAYRTSQFKIYHLWKSAFD